MEERIQGNNDHFDSGVMSQLEPTDPINFRAGCWRAVIVQLCGEICEPYASLATDVERLDMLLSTSVDVDALMDSVSILRAVNPPSSVGTVFILLANRFSSSNSVVASALYDLAADIRAKVGVR